MNERHSVTTLAVHALPVGDDHVVKHLPLTFRVQSIARLYFDGHDKMNRAVLFHERASLTVEWLSRSVDVRIVTGGLVSIRWLGRPTCVKGAVRIARLVPLDRPEPSLNLFDTVPSNWLADRALLRRAGAHWDGLQPSFRHLFNASSGRAIDFVAISMPRVRFRAITRAGAEICGTPSTWSSASWHLVYMRSGLTWAFSSLRPSSMTRARRTSIGWAIAISSYRRAGN